MISIRQLHKSFGPKQVLRGVNLEIGAGQSAVIIGGSGSGKSVLLKNILGLMKPDLGEIWIDDQRVDHLARNERAAVDARMGMLFQNGALFDSLPIWENVAFADRQHNGVDEATARQIAREALERVELGADLLDLYPASLSGGMNKRVGLARAIAHKPDIIFFDEPTTGLDPIMTDVINHLIVECVRDLGATTLTITHDMSSVRAIADVTAFLYQGQFLWTGNQAELDDATDPFLRQFISGAAEGPIEIDGTTH